MESEPVPLADRLAEVRSLAGRSGRVAPADSEASDVNEALAALRAGALLERWERTVPARFAGARLSGLRPGPAADAIAGWARSGAGNLVIVGPVGVGKTWAAWAAARARVEAGCSCSGASLSAILEGLRPERSPAADLGADVLVLDDVGVEARTPWAIEQVDRIVDSRWSAERPMVVTSNLEPARLADWLGERSWSRLAGGAVVVALAGPDRRFPKESV